MNLVEKFSNVENALKTLSAIVSSLVGLVSLFYLPGFIITNLYLASYGVRDFSLARVTYLSVGSTFIVFHALLVVLIFALKPTIESISAGSLTKPWVKHAALQDTLKLLGTNILLVLSYALKIIFVSLIALTPFLLLNVLQSGNILDGDKISSPRFLYIVATSGLILFLIWMYSRPFKYLLPSIAIFGLIIAVVLWSRFIYPDINPAFNGGRLVKIQLVIADTETAQMLTETGLTLDSHISLPLGLIDDTGERLIVLLQNGNVASIDKELVTNIVYVRSSPDQQHFSPAIVTSPTDLTAP